MRQIAERQQSLKIAGSRTDRVVGLIALGQYILASELKVCFPIDFPTSSRTA